MLVELRVIRPGDWMEFAALEEQVWDVSGVETIPQEIFQQWTSANPAGFMGVWEEARLLGYTYTETIRFNPYARPSLAWKTVLRRGYRVSVHDPSGNTVYGVSMAVLRPGVGRLLLDRIVMVARQTGKEYFVSICRLPGLARFFAEAGYDLNPSPVKRRALALEYAVQCARRVDGALSLRLAALPSLPGAPRVRHKDPVLGRFLRIGKVLHDVVPAAFLDPQSSNYGAVLVMDLRP